MTRKFSKEGMKSWYLASVKKSFNVDVYRVYSVGINTDIVGGLVAKAGTTEQDFTRYADKPNGWSGVQGDLVWQES